MSVFEPAIARAQIANCLSPKDRAEFHKTWNNTVSLIQCGIPYKCHFSLISVWLWQVKDKVVNWVSNRPRQSIEGEQLEWEAEIVAYVNAVYSLTKVHGNSKSGTPTPNLPKHIPIYGPRFVPPGYLHQERRHTTFPKIEPVVAYLMPLTVIHPFYFGSLKKCPQCNAEDGTNWNSWVNTGHRDLLGVRYGEGALGYQLRCKLCQQAGRDQYCFATTSAVFWQKWEFWAIPRM